MLNTPQTLKQEPGLAFADTEAARNAVVGWLWADQFSESILHLIQTVDWRVIYDLGQMQSNLHAKDPQQTVGAFAKTTAILMLLKEQEPHLVEFREIAKQQIHKHHESRYESERSEPGK